VRPRPVRYSVSKVIDYRPIDCSVCTTLQVLVTELNTYSLLNQNKNTKTVTWLDLSLLFKRCFIMSLKLLYSTVSISRSCTAISLPRITAAFVKSRTLCSVAFRRVSSRHAARRLNREHSTNTSDRSLFGSHGTARWFSAATASSDDMMTVFDRNTKRKQRNRTADLPDYNVYDYLKDEVY